MINMIARIASFGKCLWLHCKGLLQTMSLAATKKSADAVRFGCLTASINLYMIIVIADLKHFLKECP